MDYIAHIRERDGAIQTVEDHLLGVKELAENYGEKIDVKHIAGLAGLLHDLGKYTEEFRNYILEAVQNPDNPPKRGSVDHSTAGGRLLFEMFHQQSIMHGLLTEIVGNSIISHHSYLQDYIGPEIKSDYLRRVNEKELPQYELAKKLFFEEVMEKGNFTTYVDEAVKELELYLEKDNQHMQKQVVFLTKYIFSILIDADRTNTRQFEENNLVTNVASHQLMSNYYEKLLERIEQFKNNSNAQHPINILRQSMSEQCDHFAEKPSGIYTLSIPTGGGKTLASLRYALKHAKRYKKERIIYILPYTTIIEQNADEIRRLFEDETSVLEHHSNVIEDVNDKEDQVLFGMEKKLNLAKDDWDYPIIFTTMVQFLNTFFAKGTRYIRRLHNLSNAVLIFDEVQKVPTHSVSLFNHALNYLHSTCNSSILLCTATQPALDYVEHQLTIQKDAEIIPDLEDVIEQFRRVDIIDKASNESFDTDSLSQFIQRKLNENSNLLVVLNTKMVVKKLYVKLKEELGEEIYIYHLSTSMCAAHRNVILGKVRNHLENNERVICISTQLIEAGVDISFECVIRSLAGLDSIAQAAGRCNRHGEVSRRNVYVVDHKEESLNKLKEIKEGKEIARRIFIDLDRDPNVLGGHVLSKQAMEKYFKEFYTKFKYNLHYDIPKLGKNMMQLLLAPRGENSYVHAFQQKNNQGLPLYNTSSFYTAAENYHVINNITDTVIVPYEEGKEIIADLNGEFDIEELSALLKKAQHYTINLYKHEMDELNMNGGIETLLEGKVFVLTEGAYSKEFGLNVDNDSEMEDSIF